MRDIDYKPQRPCRRANVPENVMHSTARYIAAEWEKEFPGCTTGNLRKAVQTALDAANQQSC